MEPATRTRARSSAFLNALSEGARNLLQGCAGLRAGSSLALIAEDPALGWYDAEAPAAVAAMARDLGAEATTYTVGDPADGMPRAVADAARTADTVIFFARVGDRERFRPVRVGQIAIVSYARTAEAMASSYGCRPYADMLMRRERFDRALTQAREIVLSCPRGTELRGAPEAQILPPPDVSIRRFPMNIGVPIPAEAFSGHVALAGYLTPTGSRPYTPSVLKINGTAFAHISRGRIMRFSGLPGTVRAIEAHYEHIARSFGITADTVHSWHAGLHDACTFSGRVQDDPDLWSNTVFGNPNYLHFHTCGDYAPGEICWMVEAPTIVADGQTLWSSGTLAGT